MRRKVDELEAEKREMSEAVDDAFKERELSGMDFVYSRNTVVLKDFVYFRLQIPCGREIGFGVVRILC